MRESRLARRLGGTTLVLGTLAVGAVPMVIGMPSSAAPRAATTGLRSVFLNGTDISSARSQDLKNVDVRINENGDLFIVAPHYQVNEEDTYVPLSKFVEGLNGPKHQPPQSIGGEEVLKSPAAVPGSPAPSAGVDPMATGGAGGLLPKAGAPTAPATLMPAGASAAAAPGDEGGDSGAEPPELPEDAVPGTPEP